MAGSYHPYIGLAIPYSLAMQIIGSCFLLPFLASLLLCHYSGLCLAVLATASVKVYLRAFYLFLLRLGLQNGRASLLLQGFHGMRLASFS